MCDEASHLTLRLQGGMRWVRLKQRHAGAVRMWFKMVRYKKQGNGMMSKDAGLLSL